MGKIAVFVLGPAGTGKTTFCATIQKHCSTLRRTVHVLNLDPAAEDIRYSPSIDVRNLISVEDVMEELNYGPNEIGEFDEDYVIVDCPGQIELFTHLSCMKSIVSAFLQCNYNVGSVFLIDSTFLGDNTRFLSGAVTALSSMLRLELPHINVLTKMDLFESDLANKAAFRPRKVARVDIDSDGLPVVPSADDVGHDEDSVEREEAASHYATETTEDAQYPVYLEKFFDVNVLELVEDLGDSCPPKFRNLTAALGQLLEDFNLVEFVPLNITSDDSIDVLMHRIDQMLQYGEDHEPVERVGDDD